MAEVEAKGHEGFSKKAKKYKVRQGHEHNGYDDKGERKLFTEGDEVMLEPHQFEAFADKFEESKEVVKETPKAPVVNPNESKT